MNESVYVKVAIRVISALTVKMDISKIKVENAKVTSQKGEKYLHEPIMNGEELEHDDQNGRRN